MNTTDKLGRAVLGLSVAIAVLCSAPTYAGIMHSFDWDDPNTVDGDPWANPPWNHFFGNDHSNEAGTGHVFSPTRGGNTGTHAVGVDNDLDPNNIINATLVTFSYDITRDSATNLSGNGPLGFYVYDLRLPNDPSNPINNLSPNTDNTDALGPDFENNFMDLYLPDNPDVLVHYDVVVNASGGTVNGLADLMWRVYRDGTLQEEHEVLLGTVAFGGFRDGFDTWGFKTFAKGEYNIDNFVVRDEFFVIPEPTALALLGLGVSAVVLRRRNRRR